MTRISKTLTSIVLLALASCAKTEVPTQTEAPTQQAKTVKLISARELYERQQAQAEAAGEESSQPGFVVIDVRTPEEFGVSMIPGAITKAAYEADPNKYEGRTAIPYCTVGGRSGRYAKQLVEQGIDVLNCQDSILGWCREGLPLVTPEGEPTTRVHTHSARNEVPDEYEAVW